MINPIYQHRFISSIIIEFIESTNKGMKVLLKDSNGNKKEKEGKIAYFSDQDIKTLFVRTNKD